MDEPTESGTMEYPKKLFYRINEVAKITGVETYVLRYWETKFPMLAPEKDSSDQRRYRQPDIELVMRIKELLYQDKFTIAGAVEKLQSESSQKKKGGRKGRGAEAPPPEPVPQTEAEDGEEIEAQAQDESQAAEPDGTIEAEDSEEEASDAVPAHKEPRPRKSATAPVSAVAASAPPPQWEALCARAVKARKELHELIAEIKQWRGQMQ